METDRFAPMSTVWAALFQSQLERTALLLSIYQCRNYKETTMKKIAIIMGSDSDLPIVEKAIATLKEFDVPYEVHVYSAHRTPEEARRFALSALSHPMQGISA